MLIDYDSEVDGTNAPLRKPKTWLISILSATCVESFQTSI